MNIMSQNTHTPLYIYLYVINCFYTYNTHQYTTTQQTQQHTEYTHITHANHTTPTT